MVGFTRVSLQRPAVSQGGPFFGSLPGFSAARNLVANAHSSAREAQPAAEPAGAPAEEAAQSQAQGEWTAPWTRQGLRRWAPEGTSAKLGGAYVPVLPQ